jgi:signal transduction histidine kinase/ActR/RegA family two-component response regulator
LLASAIAVLSSLLVILAAIAVGETGIETIHEEVGHSLAVLADQMQESLDRGLFERSREISTAAASLTLLNLVGGSEDAQHRWLAARKELYPEYSGLAILSPQGRVLTATDRKLEGADFSSKPWFKSATEAATVGDIREDNAFLSPDLAAGQTAHFVDIAAPIRTDTGETRGVLVASLDWTWVKEIHDSVFGATGSGSPIEIIVLTRKGVPLIGPKVLQGKAFDMSRIDAAKAAGQRFTIGPWPDEDQSYVTGVAESDGYRSFPGLRWTVLVRRKVDGALAGASRLQQDIVIWGAGLTLLAAMAAWFLAGRMATPLLQLSDAAAKIRRGEATEIPKIGLYAEAAVLAQSMRVLVSELQSRQHDLAELNASLESQVAERTRRLAEQNVELEAAKIEAETATAAKSRFLASASHDLRQPLHAMSLFARALSRRIDGEEARHLLAQIELSLASLRSMFDALLNVSRLDAGLVVAHNAPVHLADLMRQVASSLRVDAESRGLAFRLHPLDVIISSDAAILEAMIRNLGSNALKFTRSGGILLAARQRGDWIAVEVYDTGPGIDESQHTDIFREFERTSDQATGENDGLGLGLSIVRRYAGLLGCRIELRSRLGHGSRFSVLIPRDQEVAASMPSRAMPAPKQAGDLGGKRILVLDDDAFIVSALVRDLTDRGGEARGFTTAHDAEAALSGGSYWPDAAVIDFDLRADESGPAFIARMAGRRGRPIPALVLSGATDRAALTEFVRSGFAWMTKPAHPDMIAAAILDLALPRTQRERQLTGHLG